VATVDREASPKDVRAFVALAGAAVIALSLATPGEVRGGCCSGFATSSSSSPKRDASAVPERAEVSTPNRDVCGAFFTAPLVPTDVVAAAGAF